MTRTASSVGTDDAVGREPQNHSPVDRQVGEADLLWLRETFDANSYGMENEFACSSADHDTFEAERIEAAAIIADLQQVTRERDEAVGLLRNLLEVAKTQTAIVRAYDDSLGVEGDVAGLLAEQNREDDASISEVQAFLDRCMEKTGG